MRAIWFALMAGLCPAGAGDDIAWERAALEDLQSVEDGELPESLFVLEGEWELVEENELRYLRLPGSPIVEGGILFGPSTKGGCAVEAKARAYRKGRSYPSFGAGVHGFSGYRLRVVPARKIVELVRDEESVLTAEYEWTPDVWVRLRLEVRQAGETWKVRGWVWPEGEARPEKPVIEHEDAEAGGQGRASIWATPYSSREIDFDDLVCEQPVKEG